MKTTNTFDSVANNLKQDAKKRLAENIITQEILVQDKAAAILRRLITNIPDNSYDLRQNFTFITAADSTLNTMYEFYKATFGEDFNREDWIEKEADTKPCCIKELLEKICAEIKQV